MENILRALDLLKAGNWDGAHKIAQDEGSPTGAWLHGVIHIIEGDESNARYWYRQAGRSFPGMGAAESEMAAIRAVASGKE